MCGSDKACHIRQVCLRHPALFDGNHLYNNSITWSFLSQVTSSGRPAVGKYWSALFIFWPSIESDLPSVVWTTMLANGNRLALGNPPKIGLANYQVTIQLILFHESNYYAILFLVLGVIQIIRDTFWQLRYVTLFLTPYPSTPPPTHQD